MGSPIKESYANIWGLIFTLVIFVTLASGQVTFNRHWVRGKYRGSVGTGEKVTERDNTKFQRVGKAMSSEMRNGYNGDIETDYHEDYISTLKNAQLLKEIRFRIKNRFVGDEA